MMLMFRWMRRRVKRCCCICCCSAVILVILVCMYVGYFYHTSKCSDGDSLQLISELCDLYNQEVVGGSFCHHLCGDSKTLHYEKCGNYVQGKRVLFMSCDSCIKADETTNIVMKMKASLNERARFNRPDLTENKDDSVNNVLKEAEELVKNSFMFLHHQDFSHHADILSFAWNWNVQEFLKNNENKAAAVNIAVDSIWSLVQQEEYLLSRDLYNYSFIPKIYGTCGPAYFVENTPTLHKYEYSFFSELSSGWKSRASVAIKLIELMETLHSMKPEYHLCDIKADNFGLRDNGDITLIDTDCSMFDQSLMDNFKFTNCTNHDDCDFFDCRSFCDTHLNKCMIKRTNNNMQSLCEDVFVGYFPKLPTGLLRDPPGNIKVRLFQLLQECSFPTVVSSRHTARDRPKDETVKSLKALLYQSIT